MRIVSLLPAATELLYALGVTPVGVSHECDYPPAAANLPSVVESRIDASATSAEIDVQVQAAMAEHGSVYALDREKLRTLNPDVVVTQGVCDVCAVDSALVETAVRDLGLDAEVVTTDVHSLADLYRDLRKVGAVTGQEEAAEEVVSTLQARVSEVESRASAAAESPTVAVLDWLDPVMVAGHWIPELVELAGGTYPLADVGAESRPREWATIRECDPDVLVAAPCGFELADASDDATQLRENPGWDDLTAVRTNRAYAMEGHHLVNRPGPRLVDTLEHLARLIHPEEFGNPDPTVAATISRTIPPR
ncbi:cobalamin-binding protein [Haladaptatus sp. QDMS2]|uniref:cobalamin-binding protein n=1 Tax=Haladaptatus sp. QDMS2 TaxID=3033391 RepID=UPI0023E7A3E2|nr:cobalamin-binding protein [Haladaptatus sp. QDMS2]